MSFFPGRSAPKKQESSKDEQYEETDNFQGDLIAASALDPGCKPAVRQMLYYRAFGTEKEVYEKTEKEFIQCVNDYATDFQAYSSALDSNGNVFYFNRETRESSWDRPEEITSVIEQGKNARDHTEEWMKCEFKHIALMQCERRFRKPDKNGCRKEFGEVAKCLKKHAKQLYGNDDDDDDEEEEEDF